VQFTNPEAIIEGKNIVLLIETVQWKANFVQNQAFWFKSKGRCIPATPY
jgi:hypothetical protein